MNTFEFELGDKLKDIVSGLEGICIGRIEYLNGCTQYAIKPKKTKDERVLDAEWVDSQQVIKLKGGIKIKPSFTGGSSKLAPRL
jgi:hypothetical protein